MAGCNSKEDVVVKNLKFPDAVKKGSEVELAIELNTNDSEISYQWLAKEGDFKGSTDTSKVIYKAPAKVGTDIVKILISKGKHTLVEKKVIDIYSSKYQSVFGGNFDDLFHSLQLNDSQGCIATGYTKSIGAGKKDCYVVSLDFKGDKEWSETFGGDGDDRFCSIEMIEDEKAYLLAGYKGYSEDRIIYAGYVVKINNDGNVIWEKVLMKDEDIFLRVVKRTDDGNYILVGNMGDSYNSDGLIVKLDSDGNKLAEKRFDINNKYVNFCDVEPTDDGGFIIIGYTGRNKTVYNRGYVIKVDSKMNLEWEKNYGTKLYGIEKTGDGKYILVGLNKSKGYLVKIDPEKNGFQEWSRLFSKHSGDNAAFYSVQILKDGNYLLAGKNQGIYCNYDGYLVKIDQNGSELWSRTYNSNYNDNEVFYTVKEAEDGGYFLGGYTQGFETYSKKDAYLVKVDFEGKR